MAPRPRSQAPQPGPRVRSDGAFAESAPDPATLAAGLTVERLEGSTWTGFAVELGHLRPPPGTLGGTDPDRATLILLPASGWPRAASYRIRLTGALTDTLGRPLTEARTIQWDVPGATGDPSTEAVVFAQAFPLGFDTWTAAGDSLAGRFPGGQNSLFQGLWTDPLTGIAHARARWYDARNASWLSEDPLLDVDSVNLYAFVGWGPHAATDPTGEIAIVDNLVGGVLSVGIGAGIELVSNLVTGDDSWDYSWKDAGVDFALGAATSGLSNLSKIKQVAKLGRVGQQGARVAAETALDFGLETARKEWKGEEYGIDDLAVGAARNAVIGRRAPWSPVVSAVDFVAPGKRPKRGLRALPATPLGCFQPSPAMSRFVSPRGGADPTLSWMNSPRSSGKRHRVPTPRWQAEVGGVGGRGFTEESRRQRARRTSSSAFGMASSAGSRQRWYSAATRRRSTLSGDGSDV